MVVALSAAPSGDDPAMPVVAGAGTVLELWTHIFDPARGGIVGLLSGRRVPGSDQLQDVSQAFFRYPAEALRAQEWLQGQAGLGRETYFCAHLLRKRRRIKANADKMMAVYVDGDGAPVPPELPQPTAIVVSSPGREQFYWRLTRAVESAVGEQLNRRFAYAMGEVRRAPALPHRR